MEPVESQLGKRGQSGLPVNGGNVPAANPNSEYRGSYLELKRQTGVCAEKTGWGNGQLR